MFCNIRKNAQNTGKEFNEYAMRLLMYLTNSLIFGVSTFNMNISEVGMQVIMDPCYSGESKMSQYFGYTKHNSETPNAFDGVMKVKNHTGL